jgi:WD40 repeat protein
MGKLFNYRSLLHTLSEDLDPWEVAWSPDGQQIVTVSDDDITQKPAVQIWDATTGQLLHT